MYIKGFNSCQAAISKCFYYFRTGYIVYNSSDKFRRIAFVSIKCYSATGNLPELLSLSCCKNLERHRETKLVVSSVWP
jgi:hypothetical protein